jgi:hypothetical protein
MMLTISIRVETGRFVYIFWNLPPSIAIQFSDFVLFDDANFQIAART